jgi:glutamate formiminotransferase
MHMTLAPSSVAPLVECVPNFSEGRDPTVIGAIRDAIAAVPGAHVLDVSSDAWHNRSVITFVAPLDTALEAAFAGVREATARIDVRVHEGVHPRLGATDVLPFVPLDGATMHDCIALANDLGERVARELSIPVYLYERAATRPERVNLAQIRRGGFELLRDTIATDPSRAPDFGRAAVHPTAGAIVIGARPFLVAYNVYVGDASRMPLARQIAAGIRESNGGMAGVKALALEVDGQAQVSMNLVAIDRTSVVHAFDAVRTVATAHGVEPTWSEIVGLVPTRCLSEEIAQRVRLRVDDWRALLLEPRVRELRR